MTIFEGSAGVMLLRFSCVQGECSATSAGHRLAQGWVYASSTKLASSSTSLDVASGETKIQILPILGKFVHVSIIVCCRLQEGRWS